MRHHFGVGLAGEFRALLFQHLPQFAEILDDAVVDHGDVVGRMRMRVVLGRPAVGRPAGVADAGWPASGSSLQIASRDSLSLPSARRRSRWLAFQRGDVTRAES
jgi:hypothetical protein